MYVNWFSKIDHRNPLLNNVRRYKYTTGEMRWYKLVCKNRILPSYTALLFKLWVTIHEINSPPPPPQHLILTKNGRDGMEGKEQSCKNQSTSPVIRKNIILETLFVLSILKKRLICKCLWRFHSITTDQAASSPNTGKPASHAYKT